MPRVCHLCSFVVWRQIVAANLNEPSRWPVLCGAIPTLWYVWPTPHSAAFYWPAKRICARCLVLFALRGENNDEKV